MARVVDFTAPGSPIKRTMRFDETDQKLVFEATQPNLNEVLSLNAALRNADRASSSLWGGASMVRVGQIPVWLLEKWWQEGVKWSDPEGQKRIQAYLNDRDYEYLRTAPGRI